MAVLYEFVRIDPGFCRIYFRNPRNRFLYCFQANTRRQGKLDFTFYRCSSDGEPSHAVPWQPSEFQPWPQPEPLGSRLAQEFHDWWHGVPTSPT